jgi:hypothetical protein
MSIASIKLKDRLGVGAVRIIAFQRLQRAAADDRRVVAGKLVFVQKLPKLQLHQLDQLFVVHHVALVQKHHDARNTHLAGQQNVLTRLGHRTVIGTHHQDRPVHLGRAGDHVLDIVRMARAVHMRIVTSCPSRIQRGPWRW